MIWNIPNILTIIRILLVPVFLVFILGPDFPSRLASFCVFLTAAITDFLDGRIARLFNQRSEFGKFADPLADKLLVAAALIAFTGIPETRIPLWLVLLILGREVGITLLRVLAIHRKSAMETSQFGKCKTAAQMTTIVAVLLLLIIRAWLSENSTVVAAPDVFWETLSEGAFWGSLLTWLPLILASITTALTVFSGLAYLWVNRKLFARRCSP